MNKSMDYYRYLEQNNSFQSSLQQLLEQRNQMDQVLSSRQKKNIQSDKSRFLNTQSSNGHYFQKVQQSPKQNESQVQRKVESDLKQLNDYTSFLSNPNLIYMEKNDRIQKKQNKQNSQRYNSSRQSPTSTKNSPLKQFQEPTRNQINLQKSYLQSQKQKRRYMNYSVHIPNNSQDSNNYVKLQNRFQNTPTPGKEGVKLPNIFANQNQSFQEFSIGGLIQESQLLQLETKQNEKIQLNTAQNNSSHIIKNQKYYRKFNDTMQMHSLTNLNILLSYYTEISDPSCKKDEILQKLAEFKVIFQKNGNQQDEEIKGLKKQYQHLKNMDLQF